MSPASSVTGRSASARKRQTPDGPPTPVTRTRGRVGGSGGMDLDPLGAGVSAGVRGRKWVRLAVADHLQWLHVVRVTEATPIARGSPQQILLQVATDLHLGAVGTDDLELALHPLVNPDKPGWVKVDAARRSLVAVQARNPASGNERGVVHIAVVLMHIETAVGIDDGWFDLRYHALDRPDHHTPITNAQAGVLKLRVEQSGGE